MREFLIKGGFGRRECLMGRIKRVYNQRVTRRIHLYFVTFVEEIGAARFIRGVPRCFFLNIDFNTNIVIFLKRN